MKSKVKILIGSHGSGKSKYLYDYFLKASRNDDGTINFDKKFILVVPEQDTNAKQRLMMNYFKDYGHGILNIDVVSFDRIAHNVFDRLNIEPAEKNIIDDAGKTMILSQVISEISKREKEEDRLSFYGKMVKRVGFAKKMTQAMSEFYAYKVIEFDANGNVIKDNIQEVLDNIKDKDSLLVKKLSDLRKVYLAFVEKLNQYHYSIKETKYDLLNRMILDDKELFKNAVVAFEGFTGFTPVQLDIFSKITEMSDEVYVVIDYRKNDKDDIYFNKPFDESDVFYLSKKFVQDINKKLSESSNPISAVIVEYNKENIVYKYIDKDDLRFLERNIYNYDNDEKCIDKTPENIIVYEAKNVDDEITNAAHIILEKTRKGKLRYEDIKIVVPSVEDYSDKIISIFSRYGIPVFIDNTKSILNSPYIEAIRAALDVVTYNFSYDSVMRYINSGIFEKNSEIFEIDNFIREYGIRGANRYKIGFEPIFDYKKRILDVKDELFGPLLSLYDAIYNKKEKMTIKEYIDEIEAFENKILLKEKFDRLIDKLSNAEDAQNSKVADKLRSYYNRFGNNFQLDVLNKSVEVKEKVIDTIKKVFGDSDEKISILEFRNIFDIGFTDVEIKILPQGLDQVVVGDLMRSRFDNPKIEICLGFNQSKVPAETSDNTLIDDAIRDEFKNVNINISQTTYETAYNQRLYLYLVLTNPKDELIISYPRLNINKSTDEKSSVISAIEKLFGYIDMVDDEEKFYTNLTVNRIDKYSLGYYSEEDLCDYIAENMQNLRREYDNKTADNKINYDTLAVKKAIKYLYNKNQDAFKYKFESVFNKINSKDDANIDEKIAKNIIDKVRGGSVASVSYIESYNSCPYKHFLEKTIKLSERKNYEISSIDLGTYIHRILELFYKNNKKEDIDKLIADKELDVKIDECIEMATKENFSFQDLKKGDEIFYGANKLAVVKRMIKKILNAAIRFINFANEGTKLTDISTEERFETKIENGDTEIIVKGTVDKIESYKDDNSVYVNVIDYKSGKKAKTISLKEIENGTSIQLILYLDYCKNVKFKNKDVIPCGAFYLWVDDPVIHLQKEIDDEELNKKINKALAYVGIANDDNEIVKNIKETLTPRSKSKGYEDKDTGFVLSGELLKGGSVSKSETDNEKFDDLMTNTRNIIKTSMENIEKGNIEAEAKDLKTCKYCPYSNICMKEKVYSAEDENEEE